MKVLVTGKNGKLVSYFRQYAAANRPESSFDFVSLRTDEWKTLELASYDALIHCAGITSAPDNDYESFYRANVELTERLFEEYVRQQGRYFIYLSSMAVYDGIGWGFGDKGRIGADTPPCPGSPYGRSKLEAEHAVRAFGRTGTKTAFVRAPSIVGAGIEAYFDRYIRCADIPLLPIPWVHTEAKRSFVYVDTLIDFLCELVPTGREGVFFPQNLPALSVSEMMLEVARAKGKKKKTSRALGVLLPGPVQKRFFSQICYEEALSADEVFSRIPSREAIARVIKGTQSP